MQKLKLDAPDIRIFLEQFDEHDKALAISILSNVRLVTASEHVQWLLSNINTLGLDGTGTVAFLIVRQLNKTDDPFYFSGKTPGSEGRDAHIVKALTKSKKSHQSNSDWLVAPSLDEMAKKKVRRLVFVCDIVGSGTELTKYVQFVFNHKTIKSWISGGFIKKIDVVASVVMDVGIETWLNFLESTKQNRKLLNTNNLDQLGESALYNPKPITEHPSFSQNELRQFLRNYSNRHYSSDTSKNYSLGYKNSEGSVIFEPNIPNNLPALLWMDGKNWKSLFRGRSMNRPELFEDMQIEPGQREWNTQIKTVIIERRYRMSLSQQDILNILNQTRSHARICRELGLPLYHVNQVITELKVRGWVSEELRVTDEGHKALNLNKASKSTQEVAPLSPTEIYIPSAR